jgi:hypothetical protein
MYAADDYSQGIHREWRQRAIERKYLAPNVPGYVAWLVFDVDNNDASTSWLDAGLASPNFIIVNPVNGHAHLLYRLRGWIKLDGDPRAVRWLNSIRRAYTAQLEGDPRFAGLLCKNPLHSAWKTTIGRDAPYDLGELARYADFFAPANFRNDTIDRTTGRNVYVFDRLRHFAYPLVGCAKAIGDRQRWSDTLHEAALRFAAEARRLFAAANHPYTDSEVHHTVKSVANWTWDVYRGRDPHATTRRRDGKRAWSVEHRRKLGLDLRASYIGRLQRVRREAARRYANGEQIEHVAATLGISTRTVFRAFKEFGLIEKASAELLEKNQRAEALLSRRREKSDSGAAGGTLRSIHPPAQQPPPPMNRLMAYVSAAIERLSGRSRVLRC